MNSIWSKAKAKASHRLAMHLRVDQFRLGAVDLQFLRALPLIDRRIDRDSIEQAFDKAQTINGWLIFYSHDIADRPSPYGCSPELMNHALEAAAKRKIPVLNMAEALLCAGA